MHTQSGLRFSSYLPRLLRIPLQSYVKFLQHTGYQSKLYLTTGPGLPVKNSRCSCNRMVFTIPLPHCTIQPLTDSLRELSRHLKLESASWKDQLIEERISTFLFKYRITPQTTTGHSSAELLVGRRLRSHLDLLHLDSSHKVVAVQDKQRQMTSNSPVRCREFNIDDKIYARNYHGSKKWIEAKVVRITGPVSYVVETTTGICLHRHVDQLCTRFPEHQSADTDENGHGIEPIPIVDLPNWKRTPENNSTVITTTVMPTIAPTNVPPIASRRSGHDCRSVDRFCSHT